MSLDEAVEALVVRLVDERFEALRAELGVGAPQERYLTVEEAAAHLRVSKHTLNMLRSNGGGPLFSQGVAGGRVQYRVSDLDEWQAGRKRANNQGRGRAARKAKGATKA